MLPPPTTSAPRPAAALRRRCAVVALAASLLSVAAVAQRAIPDAQAPAAATGPADAASAARVTGWQLAGRLGLAQYIVVPAEQARDRAYHDAVIAEVCPADGTCFLRFFTNTENAPLAMPLPDAIEHQPTAMFQRSAKMRREMFQWACRLQVSADPCF